MPNNAGSAASGILTEKEVKEMISQLGVKATNCHEAFSLDEVLSLAENTGFPVVLKVNSLKITHKSDIGGVRLNLGSKAEVKEAYQQIMARSLPLDPGATVTVQRMAKPGLEVIVGMTTTPQFGRVVMFGLGGIYAELLKDTSFSLVPVTRSAAEDMVRSINGRKLLQGFRGGPAADQEAIIAIIEAVSALCEKHPKITELDLNPVIVYERGAVVVDARAAVIQEI